MKRTIVWIAIVAVVLLLTSPCMATFPKPDYYQYYSMRLGWYENQQAWFISTTTNKISFSGSTFLGQLWNPYFAYPPVLSGRLSYSLDAVPKVARPLYAVPDTKQPPVFDTRPSNPDYSGVWQVFLVIWKTNTQWTITNADPASPTNPTGLPSAAEANIVPTTDVVDLPIVAIGQLGGPWQPAPPGAYRIKQGFDYDATGPSKMILLPQYYVYAVDPYTGHQVHAEVLITEADDQATADLLGANYAPGLTSMPDVDTQALWVMNSPKPAYQLPIVEQAESLTALNTNQAYTPLMRLTYLDRNIPAYTVVNNPKLVKQLIGSGRLSIDAVVKINANVNNVFDAIGPP